MSIQHKPIAKAVLLGLLAWCSHAMAQGSGDNAPTVQLPEVLVQGQLADDLAHGSSLKPDQLATAKAASSDSAQLLADIPGLYLHGAGGFSSLPVLHGLADDRLLISSNGMNLLSSCPNHMNSPLSYLASSAVDSVQVYGATAPVSVGGDNIGGVIVVNSPAPHFAAPGQTLSEGEVGTYYRSNGKASGANLSATVASDTVSINYSGATSRSDDYNAAQAFKAAGQAASGQGWLDGDTVGSSAYKTQNHQVNIAWRDANQLLEMTAGIQDTPYEGFPNQRMDMTSNHGSQFSLHYKADVSWGDVDVRLYQQYVRHEMNFGDDKQLDYMGAIGMPMDTASHTQGGAATATIRLDPADSLKLGTEFQRYQLNDWWPPVAGSMGMMGPNTFWNINDGQRNKVDVFAEWQADWNAQWRSILGARSSTVSMDAGNAAGYSMMYGTDVAAFNAENHQRTDHNIDLSALTRFTPSAGQQYELAYAQKTRSPNLYETYPWSGNGMAAIMNNFVGDGNGYVGNVDLKPEVAHSISANADWHDANNERWSLQISPYYSYITDYIDAKRCGSSSCLSAVSNNLTTNTGYVILQYTNDSAQLYGIDIKGKLQLANTADYGRWNASAQISYTRGENLSTGDNLYNIMPLNAKLALVQQRGPWSNTAELLLVSAKTDVSQVRNEVATPGYNLFNLRSSYQWKQLRIDVGIDNVFNRYYVEPLGGAYVGQGATMGINSIPWGLGLPGPARSLYTALSYRF